MFRTKEQMVRDLANSRAFEAEVRSHLGKHVFDNTNSTDRLDFVSPQVVLEVKEKRQRLNERWWLIPGVEERDLFVLDELTVRKACEHWPNAYLLLRDVPGGDRLFLVSIVQLVCVERVRVDRISQAGNAKGKWILDLNQFRQIESLEGLEGLVREDIVAMRWKNSEALSIEPVRAV